MSTESTLGILPEGWDTRTLKLCLEKLKSGKYVERGWSPQCLSRPAQNAWGVLKTTSVQMGEFLPEYNKELPKSLEPKTGLEVNDGDFLVTTTGPRNRCGVICRVRTTPRNLIFSGKILRFRADESQVLGSYLMYLLMSPGYQKELDGLKVGTSDSSVSIGNQQILDLEIPLASIEEQAKIVEILEEQLPRLDAALASVRGVREKAARFRRSLLHAAFTGALTGHDTLNEQTPEGWQQLTLGDLVSISDESGIPAVNPILPYVGMEHIESETGKLLSYGDPAHYRSSSYIVNSTQVLYGRLRPYLNKVFIPKEDSYASREFIPMRMTEDLNQQFLLHRLRSSEFVAFAMSLNTGDRPRVKWPQIAEYSICLPSIEEQIEIVEILEEQLFRLGVSLKVADEIEMKASALRRSLLHAAFTGELTREWREGAHV